MPTLVFRVVSPSKTVFLNWVAVQPVGYVETLAGFVGSLLQPVVGPGFAFVYQDVSIVGFVMSCCVDEYVLA